MHSDARMPEVDRCVLRPVLDRHAVERPDKVFAVFENGEAAATAWRNGWFHTGFRRERRA